MVINTKGVYFTFLLACSGKYKQTTNKNFAPINIDSSKNINFTISNINKQKLFYEDYSEIFYLSGNFTYINSRGFLSADEFNTVDVI